MSPENTHKLIGFYMEVLIQASYVSTIYIVHVHMVYMLLSAVSHRVYRVNTLLSH